MGPGIKEVWVDDAMLSIVPSSLQSLRHRALEIFAHALFARKNRQVWKNIGEGGGHAAHYLERLCTCCTCYVLAAFLLKSNKQTLQMK